MNPSHKARLLLERSHQGHGDAENRRLKHSTELRLYGLSPTRENRAESKDWKAVLGQKADAHPHAKNSAVRLVLKPVRRQVSRCTCSRRLQQTSPSGPSKTQPEERTGHQEEHGNPQRSQASSEAENNSSPRQIRAKDTKAQKRGTRPASRARSPRWAGCSQEVGEVR